MDAPSTRSIPRQEVTLHGHTVSYRRAGSGPTLLLIHGMAGSSNTWKEAMGLLARDFDVIAPDLLGHGKSAKPMGDYSLGAFATGLRDLLAVLDVPHATVVGNSLGGGVAMQFAYQYPEMCERLVLVGSGGLGREVSPILRALTLPWTELVMPLVFTSYARDAGNAVSGFLRSRGILAPRATETWRAYTSLVEAENRGAFLRTLRAVVDPGGQSINAHDRLYLAAAKPTLIIWGDADGIIPVAHAYAAHEAMPGSRLEIFEGVGHFVHAEAPLRFAELLAEFVATTDPVLDGATELRSLLVGDQQPTPAAP